MAFRTDLGSVEADRKVAPGPRRATESLYRPATAPVSGSDGARVTKDSADCTDDDIFGGVGLRTEE
jgi:hypothetical protein